MNTNIIYGTVTALVDTVLSTWGKNAEVPIKKGEILDIIYHDFDGTLGVTNSNDVELILPYEDRKQFVQNWIYDYPTT